MKTSLACNNTYIFTESASVNVIFLNGNSNKLDDVDLQCQEGVYVGCRFDSGSWSRNLRRNINWAQLLEACRVHSVAECECCVVWCKGIRYCALKLKHRRWNCVICIQRAHGWHFGQRWNSKTESALNTMYTVFIDSDKTREKDSVISWGVF